ALRTLELSPEWSFQRSMASNLLGISLVLAGDDERADEVLTDAAVVAKELGMHGQRSVALAHRSLLAAASDDLDSGEQLALDALGVVREARLEAYMTSANTYAALGRVALQRRDLPQAQAHLTEADRL